MYSSVVSVLMIFVFYSCFISSSIHDVVATTSTPSSSMIKQVCSNRWSNFDSKLCIHILLSKHQIASATNLFDLSIGIMELGISNATNTRTYIDKLLKKLTDVKGAVRECKLSYDSVIGSLKSALSEVRDDKEYLTATYDLLIASTDSIERCANAVVSGKVEDETILIGNKVVPIFGLSAYNAVDSLTH
ncbi:uncharacterized protein LOC105179312 [Sesamum indicum]|uniref:Uncharacterized protein LOC105179312 n=1 Tax=Sesamum indicum TaxID=4182 RepID=A0A6I9V0U2_SESIN|nr:uncharacterized protein LOC105179312 [Sesamum indicum]